MFSAACKLYFYQGEAIREARSFAAHDCPSSSTLPSLVVLSLHGEFLWFPGGFDRPKRKRYVWTKEASLSLATLVDNHNVAAQQIASIFLSLYPNTFTLKQVTTKIYNMSKSSRKHQRISTVSSSRTSQYVKIIEDTPSFDCASCGSLMLRQSLHGMSKVELLLLKK
ncbi:hypothetical protein GOP47_0018021 [Adiantum capillus-veneris]|uniref:Uncharacterized protein n=1 Tax=Adiantum capillus-veneris TaxID=13818 RepID=A0A9D4Z9S0_ADICA|nr:hypothetical protein GOP47_0018021 [Adiantum capillus-veneris]